MIQDHLELKRRNADLELGDAARRLPVEDPFDNHPLFKTEEQARLEETMDGEPAVSSRQSAPWPGEESGDEPTQPAETEEDTGLWSRSRDFDWGD